MSELRRARQARIRAAIHRQPKCRRVWVLPVAMVERILDYQEEKLLPSETAAVSALLDEALRTRGI